MATQAVGISDPEKHLISPPSRRMGEERKKHCCTILKILLLLPEAGRTPDISTHMEKSTPW